MSDKDLHIETRLILGGYAPDPQTGATTLPIYQSSAFAYETAEELEDVFAGRSGGFLYTRINNPTLHQFEQRLTGLESGIGAVSCASGMAAITTTILTLAGAGDHIISGATIFGGTYALFQDTLTRLDIQTTFVNPSDPAAFEAAIADNTRAIFIETMGNPKLNVPNIQAIADVAKKHGIVLVVDNTLTPLIVQPKDFGADIVIHSTSKYINGHGNAIGGIVIDCGTFDWSSDRYPHIKEHHERVRHFAFLSYMRSKVFRDTGACFSPFNAFLMSIGLESLGVRMDRQCTSALTLATFLENHKETEAVVYAGLSSHPDHAIATDQFGGRYGALLAVRLGSKERSIALINNLKRAQILANLGDAKTLVTHPATTFCREFSEEDRLAMGAPDDLVRVSVGLEHPDDIVAQ